MRIFLIITLMTLTSCARERTMMKSPCVGLDSSPCGVKRAVNSWWA